MKYLGVLLYVFISNYCAGSNKQQEPHRIIINRNVPNLKKIVLLSGKAIFLLPSNLNRLSEPEIDIESPVKSQRPTYVFEDKVGKIKFAVNYGSSPATDKDLPQIKNYLENLYRATMANIITSELKTINNRRFAIIRFELLDRSGDGKVFNYLFITTIAGKLFMVDYSFPSKQILNLEKQAVAVLNTAKIQQ